MITGVDGHKKGWIAAIDDSNSITVHPYPTFAEIAQRPDLDVVAVDIHIGVETTNSRAIDSVSIS